MNTVNQFPEGAGKNSFERSIDFNRVVKVIGLLSSFLQTSEIVTGNQ